MTTTSPSPARAFAFPGSPSGPFATVIAALLLAAAATVFAAATPAAAPAAAPTAAPTAWEAWLHVPGILDLAGPRTDGRLVAAVRGRLALLSPTGELGDFAPAYHVPDGKEPYIVMSPGLVVDGTGCGFAKDEVLALDLRGKTPGITRISVTGTVSRLAAVHGVSTLSGIALDTVGAFGHRLLVIGPPRNGKTRITAVDCRGRVESIGTVGKPLEGGVAVAPRSFGRYGGQLVAPDEGDGSIYAVSARGHLSRVAASHVPAGADIGVESVGFVPPSGITAAYLADRGVPGNPHPGTDSVLRLRGASLTAAGVRPGDLLVGTEGGATVVEVRCGTSCGSTVAATGPPPAHAEGHLMIIAGERSGARGPTPTSSSSHTPGRGGAIALTAVTAVVLLLGLAFGAVRRRRRSSRSMPGHV